MRLFKLAFALTVAVALTACSYGHKNYNQAEGPFKEPDDFVIQVDDYGTFWEPEVAARALDTIARESKKTNTIVLLYIHGWHHNASMDDRDVKNFAETLREVRHTLDDKVGGKSGIYRRSREQLTGNGDVKVIGLYVGWRGKSLPMPLDYLTFWGRKTVAERVGEGDLRELLLRLNAVYRERNDAREGSRTAPFMGMVSIGHSFGGQVLFKAASSTIEQQLIEATSVPSPKAGTAGHKPLSGFGDLVVLLNPALEALQYERIHKLSRQIEYGRNQTPLLLVLSADTDYARKFFFPLGRAIASVTRPPFRENQSGLWKKALGEYEPQRTHSVAISPAATAKADRFDPQVYVDKPCDIVNFDLTHIPTIGGVQLSAIQERHQVFNPFLVAYATDDVIIKHSGIFEDALRNFLNDYTAIAEGKRMLLSVPEMQRCPASAR